MKVGMVVKMFWNMIAIQVTLGPRRYHWVEGDGAAEAPGDDLEQAAWVVQPVDRWPKCTPNSAEQLARHEVHVAGLQVEPPKDQRDDDR